MKQTMRPRSERVYRVVLCLLLCVVFLGCAGTAAAQKDKKKKDAPSDGTPTIPLSDEAQIDYMISTMLGAWQIGDTEKLHLCYGDDVIIVNGVWAPPMVGWTQYAPVYQQQRARMQQVRMDRSNTLIKVDGTVGWATYQWDFSASVDGQPSASQGITTLVVEKRNNRWVIVLNHTSLAAPGPKNTTPATQPPSKPGGN